MKINSENAKRQRTIARRMKSGNPLVGLLAGLAVSAAISGCKNPDWRKTSGENYPDLMGAIACPDEQPAEVQAVKEVGDGGACNIKKTRRP